MDEAADQLYSYILANRGRLRRNVFRDENVLKLSLRRLRRELGYSSGRIINALHRLEHEGRIRILEERKGVRIVEVL